MTKTEKEEIEVLKTSYQMNKWEDFLLVLNEIRQRDKDIIFMYRNRFMRFKNGCNNAINELELMNGSKDIAVAELKKVLELEVEA